jgi:hypothetical protein
LDNQSFLDGVHVTINNTIASRYWGSTVGGIFYSGGPVNFTDLITTKDDKWGSTYLLVGMVNPLDTLKWDHNGGTEYYAGIGRTLSLWKGGDKNLPLLNVNALVMYDAISRIKQFDNDVIQQKLRLDLPRVPVFQPYVEGYHWFPSGDNSPPTGFFGRLGIHRQQPLGFTFRKSEMELGVDLSTGYSDSIFGASSGLAYYRMVLSTEFKISEHFRIAPSIIGQLPGGGQERGRAFVDRSRVFYNLSIRYDF